MDNKSFPSTTTDGKEERATKLKPVTSGVVSTEKRSGGIFERLGGGTPKEVGNYLVQDILLPAAKNLIGDFIADGIHMLLWGTPTPKGKNGGSRISYNNYWNGGGNTIGNKNYNNYSDKPESSKSPYKFDEIIINSRGEAEEVLTLMREIVDVYDRVSIADYYELVGVTGNYTDVKYGWTNLNGVDVRRTRNGYFIDLPKAGPI